MESSTKEATPILSIEAVTKRYSGVVALHEASLQVERGEIRAVLGKNGAGKSTLVNVLSGAVQPDAGRILKIIARIMALSEEQVDKLLDQVMQEFRGRHQRR